MAGKLVWRAGQRHRTRSYLTFAARAQVKVVGEATPWDMVSDSGSVKTRAFCPACGSPISLTFASMPDLFTVHAASLDDLGRYAPQAVTYGGNGRSLDHVDPALPKLERMPRG